MKSQTISECIADIREQHKHDTRRPQLISFCPSIAEHPKIGVTYTQEIGFYASIPDYLENAEVSKVSREGTTVYIIYKNTPELQRETERRRYNVVS